MVCHIKSIVNEVSVFVYVEAFNALPVQHVSLVCNFSINVFHMLQLFYCTFCSLFIVFDQIYVANYVCTNNCYIVRVRYSALILQNNFISLMKIRTLFVNL